MLTGKRYRLNAATLAIESSGDKRIAITLMEGENYRSDPGTTPRRYPDGGYQMEWQRASNVCSGSL